MFDSEDLAIGTFVDFGLGYIFVAVEDFVDEGDLILHVCVDMEII